MELRVLIVEDDEIIREGLELALRQEGCRVYTAGAAGEAAEIIRKETPIDFYLLDILLPDGDGFTVCREIRKRTDTPILFLTACDDEVNTVRALEQGADDYISKPFRIRELIARMKAILRRTNREEGKLEKTAQVGKNQIHLQTGRVYCGDEEVILTAMEYRLLLIFLNHRGQTLSRRQILNQIWDEAGDFVNDNTLSVYVKRLRKKLGDTAEGQLIQTVRGVGYRMEK
jgi:DNA-binding response OmpR family regulator